MTRTFPPPAPSTSDRSISPSGLSDAAQRQLAGTMATDPPVRFNRLQWRGLHAATLLSVAATRVEMAPRRRVRGIRHVAFEDHAIGADARIRLRHCRKQRFGIRMFRRLEQRLGAG